MNKLYKNKENKIFGLSPLDIQNNRHIGLVELTEEEVELHFNPIKTEEQIEAEFRAERNVLLSKVDIAINIAFDNNLDTLEELKSYRQALRDSTENWILPTYEGDL